jgi:hypothetical protein
MRRLFLCALFVIVASSTTPTTQLSYQALNPELGIVYRPTAVDWDSQQWNAMFSDPSPPAGWAMLILGRESCSAISSSWLNAARRRGFQLGIVINGNLNPNEIQDIVACAAPLGFRRIILDEYMTWNILQGRSKCTVINEMRSITDRIRRSHPSIQFGVDENWHIWMEQLKPGQSDSCSGYPYFKTDYVGLSVYTKYGNPSGGICGRPTAGEMEEQSLDVKPFIKDYSRSGKVFVWQLNQNWYPGGENTLQFFRRMKTVYGWDRFFLFGPTNATDNWAYNTKGPKAGCPGAANNWYLPARQYLIRITEGQKPSMTLTGPQSAARSSVISYDGRITVGSGLQVGGIELQYIPPAGSPQSFTRRITAPNGALLAFVGARVNSQLQDPIKDPVHFSWQRAQMFEEGSNQNMVSNGEFDSGTDRWLVLGTTPVQVVTSGSEKSLEVNATKNQNVQITSTPIQVRGGRTYIVNFDARIFRESRNGAYFFVGWNNPGEIRRDRMFMNFPLRQTLMATSSASDGRFRFTIQPTEVGIYQLFAFFKGTRSYQPAQASIVLNVN